MRNNIRQREDSQAQASVVKREGRQTHKRRRVADEAQHCVENRKYVSYPAFVDHFAVKEVFGEAVSEDHYQEKSYHYKSKETFVEKAFPDRH